MKKFILLNLLIILSFADKINYSITYNTNPIGAVIICNGIQKGFSPLTLTYSIDRGMTKMRTIHCSARWVSGAKAEFNEIWDLIKFPNGVQQTLQRPNFPGYEKDIQFSLKVQQMKIQKQQALMNAYALPLQDLRNLERNFQLQNINNTLRFGY